MIYTEAKKLRLIEVLIKENDDEVLKKVEKILITPTLTSSAKFANFSNKLTDLELEELEKNIEDGCEQINENDWK
jgi:hypothetical protein